MTTLVISNFLPMKKFIFFFVFLFLAIFIHAQTYSSGESVQILWKGQWYPGKILKADGEKFLISYDGYGKEWNETVAKDRLKKITSGETVNNIAVTTNGDANFRSVETIWDLTESSDSKFIYAASAYGNVKILNASDLTQAQEIKTGSDPAEAVSVSKDGMYLAAGANDSLLIYKKNIEGNLV